MKRNDTINILILVLCFLLLGFVYVNTRLMDNFEETEHTEMVSPDRDSLQEDGEDAMRQ